MKEWILLLLQLSAFSTPVTMDWQFGFLIWSAIFKMKNTSLKWRYFLVSMCTAPQSTSRWKIRSTNMGNLWMISEWSRASLTSGWQLWGLFLGGSRREDKNQIWPGISAKAGVIITTCHGCQRLHSSPSGCVCVVLAPRHPNLLARAISCKDGDIWLRMVSWTIFPSDVPLRVAAQRKGLGLLLLRFPN